MPRSGGSERWKVKEGVEWVCKPENLLCWGVEKGDNERTYTCKNIETTPAYY